jgi:hypothetical protein
MNLVKKCSALVATLACSVLPSFAAGHGHTATPPHPVLTPVICALGGVVDEATIGYISSHGKSALTFSIADTAGFADVGVGAFVDGVQGTGFFSMVVTLDGFDPNFSPGPIIYLAYDDPDPANTCFFAGSLAELGSPKPVPRLPLGTYKFTFTPANMLSICAFFDGSNLPFVPTGAIIEALAIGTVTPGNSFQIDSVVVNNKNVLITPHVAGNENCDIFDNIASTPM